MFRLSIPCPMGEHVFPEAGSNLKSFILQKPGQYVLFRKYVHISLIGARESARRIFETHWTSSSNRIGRVPPSCLSRTATSPQASNRSTGTFENRPVQLSRQIISPSSGGKLLRLTKGTFPAMRHSQQTIDPSPRRKFLTQIMAVLRSIQIFRLISRLISL